MLTAALALNPKMPEAENNLGSTYWALGKKQEATDHYQAAVLLDPKCAPAHFNLGNAYLNAKLYEQAIASFSKVTELDPRKAAVYHNLGIAYERIGKFPEAIAAHRKATEVDPADASLALGLALALRSGGKADEALAMLTELAAKGTKLAGIYLNLGLLQYERKDYAAGAVSFQRAVELDRKDWSAQYNLGLCSRQLGKTAEGAGRLPQGDAPQPQGEERLHQPGGDGARCGRAGEGDRRLHRGAEAGPG